MHQVQPGTIALCYMQDWLKSTHVQFVPENLALVEQIKRAAYVTQEEARAFLCDPHNEQIAFCFVRALLQRQMEPAWPENKVLVEKIAKIAKVDTNVAETFLTSMQNDRNVITW
jgi:hypothetical protein